MIIPFSIFIKDLPILGFQNKERKERTQILMKKITCITVFLLLILPLAVFSQSSKIDYANRAYDKHLYETSVKLYSKVLEKRRSLKKPKSRLAECYMLLDEWHEAELWYGKIVNATQRPKKRDVYRYVQALQTNGKYEIALDWIEPLVQKDSTDKLAQLLYNACLIDTVEKYNEDFLEYYELSRLPFNTEKDEFSPVLLEDNSLLFSRGQTGKTYGWYVPVYEPYALKFLQAKPSKTSDNAITFSKKLRKYNAFSSNSTSCCDIETTINCSNEVEINKKGCCENEYLMTSNADFVSEVAPVSLRAPFSILLVINHVFIETLHVSNLNSEVNSLALFGDLPIPNRPICISHQVFII